MKGAEVDNTDRGVTAPTETGAEPEGGTANGDGLLLQAEASGPRAVEVSPARESVPQEVTPTPGPSTGVGTPPGGDSRRPGWAYPADTIGGVVLAFPGGVAAPHRSSIHAATANAAHNPHGRPAASAAGNVDEVPPRPGDSPPGSGPGRTDRDVLAAVLFVLLCLPTLAALAFGWKGG